MGRKMGFSVGIIKKGVPLFLENNQAGQGPEPQEKKLIRRQKNIEKGIKSCFLDQSGLC
jgi:hypothetical protein